MAALLFVRVKDHPPSCIPHQLQADGSDYEERRSTGASALFQEDPAYMIAIGGDEDSNEDSGEHILGIMGPMGCTDGCTDGTPPDSEEMHDLDDLIKNTLVASHDGEVSLPDKQYFLPTSLGHIPADGEVTEGVDFSTTEGGSQRCCGEASAAV